jgi:hypothetical protein
MFFSVKLRRQIVTLAMRWVRRVNASGIHRKSF